MNNDNGDETVFNVCASLPRARPGEQWPTYRVVSIVDDAKECYGSSDFEGLALVASVAQSQAIGLAAAEVTSRVRLLAEAHGAVRAIVASLCPLCDPWLSGTVSWCACVIRIRVRERGDRDGCCL